MEEEVNRRTVILPNCVRVHDATVAKDYYTAYAVNDCLSPVKWEFSCCENSPKPKFDLVRLRRNASFTPKEEVQAFPAVLRRRLLLVVEKLKDPELDTESRLALTEQLCGLLEAESTVEVDSD